MRIKTDIPLSLAFIKNAIGKTYTDEDSDTFINAISTDTRELMPGDLFIPLTGENFNAEIFVNDAVKFGAYAISSNYESKSTFKVKSTLNSLLLIAKAYKKLLNLKYTVAVTGSVGKTTTKNLIIKLLSKKFKVHGTALNYNNEIGVPLTLLNARKDTEVLVIEAGMNHPGELSLISKTIEPDISVITKIGTAHIGNLGSREKIAKAKLEILDGMKDKFAIIPYNEPLLCEILHKLTISAKDANADVYISNLKSADDGILFNCHFKDTVLEDLYVKSKDAHIPECLSFGIAVCLKAGLSEKELKNAITSLDNPSSLKFEYIGKINILDDSYNSSPESVEYAFKTLSLYKKEGCSAVLGDMLELGEESERLHKSIGKAAAEAKLSALYIFGEFSSFTKAGAVDGGMSENRIFVNSDITRPDITALQILSNSLPNETILLKGSRKMQMERIKEKIELLYRLEKESKK